MKKLNLCGTAFALKASHVFVFRSFSVVANVSSFAFIYVATHSVVCILIIDTALATELEPFIVTATRTAQTADETLAPVTVITREDIQRQQAQSVRDLLHGLAGLSIANGGGKLKPQIIVGAGSEDSYEATLGISGGDRQSWLNELNEFIENWQLRSRIGKLFDDSYQTASFFNPTRTQPVYDPCLPTLIKETGTGLQQRPTLDYSCHRSLTRPTFTNKTNIKKH